MAANLLSSVYHEIIQADQMQKGFKSLLNSVDDLKLDVPSAEDDLALFLARGVIDDILPPAFLLFPSTVIVRPGPQRAPNGPPMGPAPTKMVKFLTD